MQSEPISKEQKMTQKIRKLEAENEYLRLKLRKTRRRPSRMAGYAILALGAFSLTLSIVYYHVPAALIGLSLAFWGLVLLYITPTSFVRSSLLDSTAISSLITINEMTNELEYEGKGVYLPPTYLKAVKGGTVFIPKKQEILVPPIEEVAEERVFLRNPNGICLTPPGLGLVNQYEDELGRDFARTNLNYLQQNLPRALIEGLQIAEDLEIKTEGNTVQAVITGSIYQDLCKEIRKTSPNTCSKTGCPLCSSIALATTRATRKPVIIEDVKPSADNRRIEVNLRLLGEVETSKQAEVAETIRRQPIPTGPILLFTGAAILIWIGHVIFNDIVVWGKNISPILFNPRTGEALSLGIGMNVLAYLLIGLIVLISWPALLLLRRGKA